MADKLDINQDLILVDDLTKGLKATPYFEDFLYKIIHSIGGEGVSIGDEVFGVNVSSNPILPAQIKSLAGRVGTLESMSINPILPTQLNSLAIRVGTLEAMALHDRLEGTVKQLEIDTAGFIGLVKTSNYTARTKEWVEAGSDSTISLPANPLVNDQVIVSNGDGTTITVDGNGNNIKYDKTDTSVLIRSQGTSLHFQLFQDAATKYWRIR
ncbi:unnamed protein product [marine sediment metagenome]|uniref:Uncharacterized protein n=1 Tax=marine sediment metagenome TaxID=412755 RepID=X0S161_9ZZZZ